MAKKIKLYSTDYVLLIDGEIVESLDIIYAKSSVEEILEDNKRNGNKIAENEKFVSMTSLSKEQQQKYIDFLITQQID